MSSRKPSARAKRVASFMAERGSMDEAFERAARDQADLASRREEARYERGCASKNRYATRAEAQDAIAACAEHGRRGLHCYRCSYCGGWHLTSKPRA